MHIIAFDLPVALGEVRVDSANTVLVPELAQGRILTLTLALALIC